VNVGFQKEPKIFEGTRNRKFAIFPASHLAKKPPKWLMAAELIETSQLFAHQIAKIDPEWLRELGAHLLRFSYSEPHWSIRNGQVMAYETATLYGLVIGERREVGYSKISPEESRAIFIRAALVEGQVRTQAPFFRHNEKLRNDLLEIENRTRRRDILVSDDAVFAFYESRIPADISNMAGFDRWRSEAEKGNPKLLFASEADFQAAETGFSGAAFPDHLEWNGMSYRLRYRFEPGHAEDGVSVELPVSQLNRLPAYRFEWVVPGLLVEKCEALIRTLPKNLRRNLVPVPDHARQLAAKLVPADRPLAVALAEVIRKEKGVLVPVESFRPDEVDDYYRMNFRLLDENGKQLESTRDLRGLLSRHGHRVQKMLEQKTASQTEKKSYTAWEFGNLPATQSFRQNGVTVTSWPALRDEGDKVSVVLTDFPHVQAGVHRQGVIRLAALALPQQVRYLHKELLKGNDFQMKLPPGFTRDKLLHDLVDAAILHACFAGGVPMAQQEFLTMLESGRARLVETGQRLEKLVRQLLEEDYKLRRLLAALTVQTMQEAKADMERQRAALLYPGFLVNTEAEWLFELPRYFRALVVRIERLPQQLVRDRQQTGEISDFLARRQQLVQEYPQAAFLPALSTYRWMIEEYRVSLFAQQLKTKVPVSAKRLEKEWQCVLDEKQNNFSCR
jgi:ATP-dependent helicase HrpA